jgi:tetratricopeptide (TPR) repeat protein
MKIYNKTLKKAYRYLRAGKNGKVVSLLEPKVPMFLENYQFYYILGVACLRNGDNGGADTYLKRAVQVDRNAVAPRLFLATLALRKKDTTEAVRIWLGILDIEPSCPQAKRGLEKIRKISDSEGMDAFLRRGRFAPLLPRIRPPIPLWTALIPVVLLLAYGGFAFRDNLTNLFDRDPVPSREGLAHMFNDLKKETLVEQEPQGFIFNMSEDQILSALKTAQSFFDAYQDDRARVEINRILYSNASENIKQRARILASYLKEPDFTDFENLFEYASVKANPYLYDGCYIRWKGRMSNLEMKDPGMNFDFLVGYETAQLLEGIVPVYTDFQVRLDSALPLEILGKIEVQDRERFTIRISSVRNTVEP